MDKLDFSYRRQGDCDRVDNKGLAELPLLLTYEQAAGQLNISRAAFYRIVQAKRIRVSRPSPKAPRIHRDDLEKFARKCGED